MDEEHKYVVGQRVVGRNPADGENAGTIVALDGEYIYEITSTSMRHALAFEKQNRKY